MLSMKDKSRKQVEKDEFEYLLFEMKKLYCPPIILVGHRLYSFSLLNTDSDLLNGYVSALTRKKKCQDTALWVFLEILEECGLCLIRGLGL